jgi:dual-specificity kinase
MSQTITDEWLQTSSKKRPVALCPDYLDLAKKYGTNDTKVDGSAVVDGQDSEKHDQKRARERGTKQKASEVDYDEDQKGKRQKVGESGNNAGKDRHSAIVVPSTDIFSPFDDLRDESTTSAVVASDFEPFERAIPYTFDSEGKKVLHKVRGRVLQFLSAKISRPRPVSISRYNMDLQLEQWQSHPFGEVESMYGSTASDDGHFVVKLGANIGAVNPSTGKRRFKLLSKLGKGTFGTVLEVWDRNVRDYRAMKVIRRMDKYFRAAKYEIKVLESLRLCDPSNSWGFIRLEEAFVLNGHACMLFEHFGVSVFEFLKLNEFRGFRMDCLQHVAFQLIRSVAFIHSLGLIHTDLKPENMLFEERQYWTVDRPGDALFENDYIILKQHLMRVIDFGSATFNEDHHADIISTRQYRAPEVILGLRWSFPADMWSVGCILYELLAGRALFQTHDDLEHLAMMEMCRGPCPCYMIQSADKQVKKNWNQLKKTLNWPGKGGNRVEGSESRVGRMNALQKMVGTEDASHRALGNLIRRCLMYDPEQRITALEALQHPFFSMTCPVSRYKCTGDGSTYWRDSKAKRVANANGETQTHREGAERSYSCEDFGKMI